MLDKQLKITFHCDIKAKQINETFFFFFSISERPSVIYVHIYNEKISKYALRFFSATHGSSVTRQFFSHTMRYQPRWAKAATEESLAKVDITTPDATGSFL